MFVLDTDVLTLVDRHGVGRSQRLIGRLEETDPDLLAATIISYEEQTRGWMAYVAQAHSTSEQIRAYTRLERHLASWKRMRVLGFDTESAKIADELRRRHRRLGIMDLRIAAIVISNDATLVTSNLRDFAAIDDLKVEDWTR